MKLSVLKNLDSCNQNELAKLEELFRLNGRRGGAGGSYMKWAESLDSVIIFPGEDGKPDGSGGHGANPDFNFSIGAIIKVKPTEYGLEIMIPGFRATLPWTVIDDLQTKRRIK